MKTRKDGNNNTHNHYSLFGYQIARPQEFTAKSIASLALSGLVFSASRSTSNASIATDILCSGLLFGVLELLALQDEDNHARHLAKAPRPQI